MSNQLSSPVLLTCPADTRRGVAHWPDLRESNLCYFIGLGARDNTPRAILSGDRNLETNGIAVGSGLFLLRTNASVGWTTDLHNNSGCVILGDGSVQQYSNARLMEQVGLQEVATNWLLIP